MSNQVYANMMEVSCKAGSGKTICAMPDVCFTPPENPATPPGIPVPYPNTGMASDTTDGSSTVKISGQEVMLKNKSYFKKSTGDEAGCAAKKGLITSKTMGKVYFNMWSMDVKIEGENVVRHLDITTHNHASMPGNTPPMAYTDAMAGSGGGGRSEGECPAGPNIGSPVNPIFGAKVLSGEEDLDFTLQGPLPLDWQRTYFSENERVGWFGKGWGSPLEVRLEVNWDSGINFIDEYGRKIKFPDVALGDEHFSPYEQLTIVHSMDDQFAIRTAEGLTLWFREEARGHYTVEQVRDRNGNTIRIEIQVDNESIYIHGSGNQLLRLQFDSQRRLTEIFELRGISDGRTAEERIRNALEHISEVSLINYLYNNQGDLREIRNRAGECVRDFSWHQHLMIRHRQGEEFEAYYQYDRYGPGARVMRHWNNVGQAWTFKYQASSTIVIDQDGTVTTYHFDANRRWIGTTESLDYLTLRYVDKYGNTRAIIDNAGNATEYVFDDRSNPISIIDPTGAITSIEWHDRFPLPVAIIDPLGRVSRYKYDFMGNLIEETDPMGGVTKYDRDVRGLVVAVTDPNGNCTTFAYNALALLTTQTDCSHRSTTFAYDANGLVTSITDPADQIISFKYDAAGRITDEILPDGKIRSYIYDHAGRVVSQIDENRDTTVLRLASDGLPIEEKDPLGNKVTYEYDRSRRLTTVRNPNGANYTIHYDQLNRPTEEVAFDGLKTIYKYDSGGYVVETTEVGGISLPIVTYYERDTMGRVCTKLSSNCRATFLYDSVGQLILAKNDDAKIFLRYDKNGQIIEEILTRKGGATQRLVYGYDQAGNRIKTELPDGRKIGYLYYGTDHLHQIKFDDMVVSDIERDALHREVYRTQGRLSTTFSYDLLGRVSSMCVKREDTSISRTSSLSKISAGIDGMHIRRAFKYDGKGLLTELQDWKHPISYRYDAAGRLVNANKESFSYDPSGNLLDRQPDNSGHERRIFNDQVTSFDGWRYSYDAYGRVISKIFGQERQIILQWDENHQLVKATSVFNNIESISMYKYDALGRRLEKTDGSNTILFLWDGDQLLQEVCGATTRTYLYEPDSFIPLCRVDSSHEIYRANNPLMEAQVVASESIETTGQLAILGSSPRNLEETPHYSFLYFHCDQIGQPRELTNENGFIVWTTKYKAWGREITNELAHNYIDQPSDSSAINFQQPLRFQGQYLDSETGLHYSRFRYYDPDIGRFLSHDPIDLDGGINLYKYAPNPTAWIDPFGLARFGSGKGKHTAKVVVKRKGKKKKQCEVIESGNMTPGEKALGFPLSSLATHTEARAMRKIKKLKSQDEVVIHGKYAPCCACKGAMNKKACATGATIKYKWRDEDGKLRTWTATG